MAKEVKKDTGATDLTKRVSVVATDKHPFASKGDKFEVHPTVAAKFLKSGYIDKYKDSSSVDDQSDDTE